MEQKQVTIGQPSRSKFENLHKVTLVSKTLAMILFIVLPFVGVYIGYTYSPEKIIEVERVIVVGSASESQNEISPTDSLNNHQSISIIENSQNPEADFDVRRVLKVDGWVAEIDRKSFSFQGIRGEVVHKCIVSQVFKDTYGGDSSRCFGTNVILLKWNGEEIIVDSLNTPDIESLFSIQSIFFNEGSFERSESGGIPGRTSTSISTSSDKTSAKLIISNDLLPCLGTLPDLCWGRNELTYAISLPGMEPTKLDIQIPTDKEGSWGGELSMFNTRLMIWNEAGSKALLFPPAPAGCPGSVYDVLDLESQTIETYRIEPIDGCFPPSAEWLDNDVFQAGLSTISTTGNFE
jgi:hypothetical protein